MNLRHDGYRTFLYKKPRYAGLQVLGSIVCKNGLKCDRSFRGISFISMLIFLLIWVRTRGCKNRMKDFFAGNGCWIRVSILWNQNEVRTIFESLDMTSFEPFFSVSSLTILWLKEPFISFIWRFAPLHLENQM